VTTTSNTSSNSTAPTTIDITTHVIPNKDTTTPSIPIRLHEVIEEALKCLVNIIVKNDPCKFKFVELGGLEKSVGLLKEHESLTAAVLFPLGRLLFAVSAPKEESKEVDEIRQKLKDLGTIQIMAQVMKNEVHKQDFPISISAVLSEALQVLFNLTLELGPLGGNKMDYKQYFPNFGSVIEDLVKILHIPTENPAIIKLKTHVISCLINIPPVHIGVIFTNNSEKTVHMLIRLLELQLNDEQDPTALTPTLMVLTTIAHYMTDIRRYMFKQLFPDRDLENEEPSSPSIDLEEKLRNSNTLGNKIIKHMTSLNMALKYFANEILFQLVEEDAQVFIKLTGFGNAAGLLAMRNLFGMGKYLKGDSG